jgi:hypothetical protein
MQLLLRLPQLLPQRPQHLLLQPQHTEVFNLPPEILTSALYTELLESCDWDEAEAEELILRVLAGEEVDERIQQIVDTLGKLISIEKRPKIEVAES